MTGDYTGPLLPLAHLLDLALAMALLLLGTGVGHHVLRRTGTDLDDPVDLLAFSTAIGLGVVSTLILALGLAGGLTGAFLVALLIGLAVTARREIRGLPALLARIPASVRRPGAGGPWLPVAWGLLALTGAFLICYGVAPPTDWDALMYHLDVPASFLQAHRVHLPADNLHATVAGLAHMLYVPLLAWGSDAGPALLNVLITLLLGVTVLRVGNRWLGGDTGALALILLWGTTTLVLVAITPRTDVSLAFFLFLGHYALLRGLEATLPPSDRSVAAERSLTPVGWVGLGAAVLGLGVGVKFNGLAYALALAPLALWILFRSGGGRSGSFRSLLLWVGIGTLAMAPWLLKNLFLVGAPFYPFLARRTAEPWLDALFAGGSAVEVVGQGTLRFLRAVQDPFDLKSLFFAPSGLNVEDEGAFYYMNRAFLLLPLWVLLFRELRLALLLVPALAYSVLALTLDVANVRYLIPAVPALTVGMAWVLMETTRRRLPGPSGAVAITGVCLVALFPYARTVTHWLDRVDAPGYALGTTSANRYLGTHPSFGYVAPAVEYVNRELPLDATILMLFEARGFPFSRAVLQDNKISNWPILAAVRDERGGGCLQDAGFDFVLVGEGALAYYQRRGLDPRGLRLPAFEDFREQCLTEQWSAPGFVLYRLAPSGS